MSIIYSLLFKGNRNVPGEGEIHARQYTACLVSVHAAHAREEAVLDKGVDHTVIQHTVKDGSSGEPRVTRSELLT